MTARAYAMTLIVLGLASVLVLVAYGATWATATVGLLGGSADSGAPTATIALAGRDVAPLGGAMGWVGLAAVAALLATRTWGRRATGAVVVLAGGIAGVAALAFGLTEAVSGGGGAFIEAALAVRADGALSSVDVSAWWILAVAGGLAQLVCGMLAVLVGPRWPRLSSRYDRASAGGAPRSAAATWDALDRGEDPTDDAMGSGPPGADAPPGSGGAPGSMGTTPRSEEDR